MGKTRGTIQVPAQADKQALEQYARESVAQRHIDGKEIKKVIVVPGSWCKFCGWVYAVGWQRAQLVSNAHPTKFVF